jgi:glycosyltransferase involved in cell wall biosynthesis
VQDYKYDVIIPVYNGASTIGDTIKSVLSQTFVPDRIIVIDDLSTDGSGDIAARLGAEVHRNDIKMFSAGSRNRGLSLASSPWVATIDADDLWHPDAISLLFGAIESNTQIQVIGGLLEPFGEGLFEPYVRRNRENQNRSTLLQKLDFHDFLKGSPLAASACLFEKNSLDNAGGWPMPTFAEDYHLLVELFSIGTQIFRLNTTIGSYRLSPSQKSSSIGKQTSSQLVALRFLFDGREDSWSHQRAIVGVWLSYLARVQNAKKPFKKDDLPQQFREGRLKILFLVASNLFEIPAIWISLRYAFKSFKAIRAKTLRSP